MVIERLAVQRTIHAAPSSIFRFLSDPNGHVTIADSDVVTGVGDTLVIHMDREALNDLPRGLYDGGDDHEVPGRP